MMLTLDELSAGLLRQLKEQGTHEETILNYRIVCTAVISFCVQHYECNQYSSELLLKYLEHTELRLKNGEMSGGYAQFKRRVVRLLKEYAEQGYANLSHVVRKKDYNPSKAHQELANRVLDESNLPPSSREVIDHPIRHFFCFIEDRNVEVADLTDDIFFAFMDSVSDVNKGSICRTFRAMKLISSFLKKHGLADLKADLTMLKVKSAPIKMIAPYTQDEIRRISDAIDVSSPTGMRDKAILLLAFETGLRAVDIFQLRLSDIDWEKAEVCVVQSKSKTPLVLTINGTVMNAIADYILHARPKCDAHEVFLTVRAPFRPLKGAASFRGNFEEYSRKASIKKKAGRSFHSIRRTFATEMSLAGVPLPTISQMLGHKSIEQDKPYLSYDKEHVSHCALSLAEVPISGGKYVSAHNVSYAPLDGGGAK